MKTYFSYFFNHKSYGSCDYAQDDRFLGGSKALLKKVFCVSPKKDIKNISKVKIIFTEGVCK